MQRYTRSHFLFGWFTITYALTSPTTFSYGVDDLNQPSISTITSDYNTATTGTTLEFPSDAFCSTFSGTTQAESHASCSGIFRSLTDTTDGWRVDMSGSVDSSSPGCVTSKSCISSVLETNAISLVSGDKVYYSFKAFGGGDWYDILFVIKKDGSAVNSYSARGSTQILYLATEYSVTAAGSYSIEMYFGSYDFSGGAFLGASIYVKDPTVNIPQYSETGSPTNYPTPPTSYPTPYPSAFPTTSPTDSPTVAPSLRPTFTPTLHPTNSPVVLASDSPTKIPTNNPTFSPSTSSPSLSPTLSPSIAPSISPTLSPTLRPSSSPITTSPTDSPTVAPSTCPTLTPTMTPSISPTTASPSVSPITVGPTRAPTIAPSTCPTLKPTINPSLSPTTASPSASPVTSEPTLTPTAAPSVCPTLTPTASPSTSPTTSEPTPAPSFSPSASPSQSPTKSPTSSSPTDTPTLSPTKAPSRSPATDSPSSMSPTAIPTLSPSLSPTISPSMYPTLSPQTLSPSTWSPSLQPTLSPTLTGETYCPSKCPTTLNPTNSPVTQEPTISPTTSKPTMAPTQTAYQVNLELNVDFSSISEKNRTEMKTSIANELGMPESMLQINYNESIDGTSVIMEVVVMDNGGMFSPRLVADSLSNLPKRNLTDLLGFNVMTVSSEFPAGEEQSSNQNESDENVSKLKLLLLIVIPTVTILFIGVGTVMYLRSSSGKSESAPNEVKHFSVEQSFNATGPQSKTVKSSVSTRAAITPRVPAPVVV